MNQILLLLYSFFTNSIFEILQLMVVVAYIIVAIKFKISGQKTARIGFILLFCTMITVIAGFDDIAGTLAQYVFILFIIAFIQEFTHFLKHENI